MSWTDFDKYTISIIGEDELAKNKESSDDDDICVQSIYKDPPPAYDDVVTPSAVLSYIDFWPNCLEPSIPIKKAPFDKFGVLVERANNWLSERSDIILRNVETTERKITYLEDIYNGKLYYKKSGEIEGTYVKGLRLYFSVERPQSDTDTIRLSYKDVYPIRGVTGTDIPMFQKLGSILDTLNTRLEKESLDGEIVSINTVTCNINPDRWVDSDFEVDCETCNWLDTSEKHTIQFLRIFYIAGPKRRELLGFHDFVPDRLKDRESLFENLPVYTGFPALIRSARVWIKKNAESVRVTNVQTIYTSYEKTHEKGFDGRPRLQPDVPFSANVEDRPRVAFLRVAYAIPIGPSKFNFLPLRPPLLTCKTFIPGIQDEDRTQYQSLHDVAAYVLAWLDATRAKVVCAEMIGPVKESLVRSFGIDACNATVSTGEWFKDTDGVKKPYEGLYCIRVYLDGPFEEPPKGWHLQSQPVFAKNDRCKIS